MDRHRAPNSDMKSSKHGTETANRTIRTYTERKVIIVVLAVLLNPLLESTDDRIYPLHNKIQ